MREAARAEQARDMEANQDTHPNEVEQQQPEQQQHTNPVINTGNSLYIDY